MESTFRFTVQLFAFLINNKLNDLSAVLARAKSILQPMVAEFNPYTPEQAEEILAERDGRGKIGLHDLEAATKFLDFAKGLHNGSKFL